MTLGKEIAALYARAELAELEVRARTESVGLLVTALDEARRDLASAHASNAASARALGALGHETIVDAAVRVRGELDALRAQMTPQPPTDDDRIAAAVCAARIDASLNGERPCVCLAGGRLICRATTHAPPDWVERERHRLREQIRMRDEGRTICPGCKRETDPTTCGCGEPMMNHGVDSGHAARPMGCDCGRAPLCLRPDDYSDLDPTSGGFV